MEKLSCPDSRVPWKFYTTSSYIEGVNQDDLQVEDVDVIVDDPNPNIFDVDPNPDIGDDTQLRFGIKSLNQFHCNMCRNFYGQDSNQMISIILLDEKDLNCLLDKNNNIPITIIETFLALLNHSFHINKGIFIHSNIQGEVNYKHVSNVQLGVKIKSNIFQ